MFQWRFERRPLVTAAFACSLAAAACSSLDTQAADAPGAAVTTGVSTQAEADKLIGDAGCSTDAQCHSVAWGAKACGGPERYLAWSSLRTDPQALQDIAKRHEAERRNDNQRTGVVSTCSMQADPGAHCVAEHCQLGRGVSGGGGALSR